jgi:hypothetical protein
VRGRPGYCPPPPSPSPATPRPRVRALHLCGRADADAFTVARDAIGVLLHSRSTRADHEFRFTAASTLTNLMDAFPGAGQLLHSQLVPLCLI